MSTDEKTYLDGPPDLGALLWEADHRSLLDLDEPTETLLRRIADRLADIWPTSDDYIDREHGRRQEAEARLEAIGAALELACGLDVSTDDDLKASILQRLALERAEGHKDALVPSRKTADSKARRLLIEGRLDVTRHDVAGDHAGLIVATCRGDSGTVYQLGYDPHQRQWRCTCQELRGNCSHLHALKLVTTTPTEGDRR